METVSTPPEPRKRRFRFRITIRTLIVLVLLIAGGLGWIVHRAKVQRDAVAAVRRVNGSISYDWGDYGIEAAHGDWTGWLENSLGTEYFHHVTKIGVKGPQVNDELLSLVGQLEHLDGLTIDDGQAITGPGLAPISRLSRLGSLGIERKGWVDADLAHFSGLTELASLLLSFDSSSKITDDGVAHLSKLRKLAYLHIDGTQITTKGLESLKGMENLVSLRLSHARITSLEPLAGFKRLWCVWLDGNPIDDDGLKACASWAGLWNLSLRDNRALTDAGLASLGQVSRLGCLDLSGTNTGDAGVAHLAGCPRLGQLWLAGTKVSDACLISLGKLTSLHYLDLQGTKISDDGAASLAGFSSLGYLNLAGTKISDDGLVSLGKIPTLNQLHLQNTNITDAGAARLAGFPSLVMLNLSGTRISDAGLASLARSMTLGTVILQGTRCTPQGIDKLKQARPGIFIQ